MAKMPVQLRIDEKLVQQLKGEENLSHLFRQLANLYLGLPTGIDRDSDDVAGIILDGLDARVYQLEKKVWSKKDLTPEELAEVESLQSQSLSLVHPKCSSGRDVDLVKGQLLIGRLALLKFEYASR